MLPCLGFPSYRSLSSPPSLFPLSLFLRPQLRKSAVAHPYMYVVQSLSIFFSFAFYLYVFVISCTFEARDISRCVMYLCIFDSSVAVAMAYEFLRRHVWERVELYIIIGSPFTQSTLARVGSEVPTYVSRNVIPSVYPVGFERISINGKSERCGTR